MNAFVINEDQMKKTILAVSGVVIVAFVSGYLLGGRSVDNTNKVIIENEAVETAANTDVAVAPLPKEKISNVKSLNKPKVKSKTDTKQAKIKKDNKKNKPKNSSNKKVAEKKKTPKKQTKVVAESKPKKIAPNKSVIKSAQTPKKEIIKSAPVAAGAKSLTARSQNSAKSDLKKQVYSIQAGMFAKEVNANSFIEKLSEKQFDAYVSDFVSSSGAKKYNVRVGKFAQRDQANVLLRQFQKSFSSPAYVVISQ